MFICGVISSAYDTVDDSYAYAFDQAGISGGISLGVVDTAMAAADAAKSASTTNNSRLQAVQTARALQNANNLMNDAQALSNGDYSAANNYEISISLGSSSASQSSETHQANALGSTIKAGNDVTIIARNDDERENSGNINSVGALIQSGMQYDADGESSTGEDSEENKGDITLIADNDINLTSAENFFESDSENKSDSAAVGLSLSTDNGLQIFVSASQTRGMVNQNDLQHLETELNANGNVSIQSGGDTTLNGGQIFGDKVTGNIGGNLNIISQQDEEHYYSEQESAGFRLGIGLYGSPSSFSMNYSKMEADSDYVAVQEQSGIYAGDGGFDITVGGETKLQGGAIVGSNPDNNVLNTGSLSWDQLENHAEFDIESMSIGISLSTSGGNANSATGGYASDDGSASSTTYSILSEGAIVVRDNPDFSRDNLKTSTDEAHQGLERIFGTDQVQYVQDEAAFQQVVGQQMPQIIGDYAKSQTDHAKYLEEQADLLDETNPEQAQALRDEATEINGKWGENGTHRIALHTATGLISGDLSGAAGSLAVAASTPLLADALQDMGVDGPLRDTILLASSAAIGGAADGGTGAFSGAGQTLNNYLSHEESELKNNLKEQLRSCKANGNCDQAKQDQLQGQINELEALDEARDLALLQASTEPQSETFQNLLGDANDAANTYEDAGILGDPENFAPEVHQDYASASSQAEMYSHQADSPTIFNLFYSTGMAGANIVEGLVSDILGGFNDINDISNIADLQNKAASGDEEAQQELQNILDEGVEDTGITWPWESAQALWDEAQDTANTADQYSENGQPDRATQTWGEFAASIVLG